MDSCTGNIEILSDKRCPRRDSVADLFLVILCNLCDHSCVHAIQCSSKLCIFKYHSFQRCITGTFTDSKQRTVYTACTVQPCGCRIADCFVEIVMSMELDQFARNSGMYTKAIDNTRNGSWDHGTRIVDTISHRITDSDLHRNLIFFHQMHKFQTERNHESVNIRSCNIFQMTSR